MGIVTKRVGQTACLNYSMLPILALLATLLICSWGGALQVSKKTGESSGSCPSGWIDATDSGLGCLYFNNTWVSTWEGAASSCQDNGASLVEIWTELELDFVRSWLAAFAASGDDIEYYWWTGGTDLGREGLWYWAGTLATVGDFVWYSPTGEPDGGNGENCLLLVFPHFLGADYPCTWNGYSICQIK